MKNFKSISEIVSALNECSTQIEAYNLCYELIEKPLIEDIKENSPRLISANKKISGYGTWEITTFVNQYHYEEYSDFLKQYSAITHDEEYDNDNFIEGVEKYIIDNMLEFMSQQEGAEF